MEIIRNYPHDMSGREMYKLIHSPNIRSVKDSVGTIVDVASFIHYHDEKVNEDTGEVTTGSVLIFTDENGDTFATNSPYFMREFFGIWDTIRDTGDTDPISIEIYEGISKKGRSFKGAILV